MSAPWSSLDSAKGRFAVLSSEITVRLRQWPNRNPDARRHSGNRKSSEAPFR
jgi:hypothetical protein